MGLGPGLGDWRRKLWGRYHYGRSLTRGWLLAHGAIEEPADQVGAGRGRDQADADSRGEGGGQAPDDRLQAEEVIGPEGRLGTDHRVVTPTGEGPPGGEEGEHRDGAGQHRGEGPGGGGAP